MWFSLLLLYSLPVSILISLPLVPSRSKIYDFFPEELKLQLLQFQYEKYEKNENITNSIMESRRLLSFPPTSLSQHMALNEEQQQQKRQQGLQPGQHQPSSQQHLPEQQNRTRTSNIDDSGRWWPFYEKEKETNTRNSNSYNNNNHIWKNQSQQEDTKDVTYSSAANTNTNIAIGEYIRADELLNIWISSYIIDPTVSSMKGNVKSSYDILNRVVSSLNEKYFYNLNMMNMTLPGLGWGFSSSFLYRGRTPQMVALTWVNGINYTSIEVAEEAQQLSLLFDCPVRPYYNPSLGWWLKDLARAGYFYIRTPYEDPIVRGLAIHLSTVLEEVGPTGRVVHLAHSGGALLTYLVAKYHLTESQRRRVHVITFGGARSITRKYFRKATNYYARNDPLLLVDRRANSLMKRLDGYGKREEDGQVLYEKHRTPFIFLRGRANQALPDHSFFGPTYHEALMTEAKKFKDYYSSPSSKWRRLGMYYHKWHEKLCFPTLTSFSASMNTAKLYLISLPSVSVRTMSGIMEMISSPIQKAFQLKESSYQWYMQKSSLTSLVKFLSQVLNSQTKLAIWKDSEQYETSYARRIRKSFASLTGVHHYFQKKKVALSTRSSTLTSISHSKEQDQNIRKGGDENQNQEQRQDQSEEKKENNGFDDPHLRQRNSDDKRTENYPLSVSAEYKKMVVATEYNNSNSENSKNYDNDNSCNINNKADVSTAVPVGNSTKDAIKTSLATAANESETNHLLRFSSSSLPGKTALSPSASFSVSSSSSSDSIDKEQE